MRSRNISAVAAAVVLAMGLVVAGGAGPAAAVGICEISIQCEPEGLAVLADSDAIAAGTGNGVAASQALVEGGTVAGTAGTASGVSGVTIGGALRGGAGILADAAAAYVGIKGWTAGNVTVGSNGTTGIAQSAGGNTTAVGQVPGWYAQSGSPSGASPATLYVTTSANPVVGGTAVRGDVAAPVACNAGTTCRWESDSGGSAYGTWGFYGYVTGGNGANAAVAVSMSPTTTGWTGTFTVPAGMTLTRTDFVNNGSWLGVFYLSGLAPMAPPNSGVVHQALTCTGANGATQTLTQDIPVIMTAGSSTPYPALTCPAGMVSGSFGATVTPEGGATTTVVPTTTTDPTIQAIPTNYPNCVDSTCLLRLFQKTPSGLTSCGEAAIACPDWYVDPNRATDYECHWGAYVVDTDRCSVYRQPGSVLPNTVVNPDGTMTYTPWPAAPTPTAPPAGQPDPSSQSCWKNGYSSFNPVQWVLTPIECALQWAFVPTATPALIEQITTTIQTKTPVPELQSIAVALAPPGTGSECMVLTLPVSFVIGHDVPLLDSCTWADPVSKLLRDYRPLFAIVVWISVISPVAWWAWRTYAPGATGAA